MLMFLEDDTGMIQKRFTWTLFHHLSTQSWPTWPSAAIPGEVQKPDPYLEVLCNVPGVENVRIARRVEDATQAAYIICKFYHLLCLSKPATRAASCTGLESAIIYTCREDEKLFYLLTHSLYLPPSTYLIIASKFSMELRRCTCLIPRIRTLCYIYESPTYRKRAIRGRLHISVTYYQLTI